MSPFVTSSAWASLIDDLTRYVLILQSTQLSALRAFLSEAEKLGYLKAAQQDALNLTIRFFDLISEFRPIVAYWDSQNPDKEFSRRLKTGKTAFHQVKALYVDAYEFISRALTLVMSLVNMHHRKSHNSFPPHPRLKSRFQASSMEDFHRLSNAPKVDLLDEEPLFRDWLKKAIDPQLRNAIGHNTVKYNSKTGDISYPLDKAGAKIKTITYGEFLNLVLRAIVRVHQLNHLIKILYVAIYYPSTNSESS